MSLDIFLKKEFYFRCAEKVQDSEIVVLDEFCDAVTRPDSLQVSEENGSGHFFKPYFTKNNILSHFFNIPIPLLFLQYLKVFAFLSLENKT